MTTFLQALHKNVQRLPSLVFCVMQAPNVRPTTAEKLGDAYRNVLRAPITVPSDDLDRVMAYITERAMVSKYNWPSSTKLRQALHEGQTIEIQDWFLSDPGLHSWTGAEREQSYVRTVSVCEELELLRGKTMLVHTYGELLVEIAKARGITAPVSGATRNPFERDPVLSLATYYQILRSDFEFQRQMLRHIPQHLEISFQEVCAHADEILRAVSRATPPSVSNRPERKWLDKRSLAAQKLTKRLDEAGWSREGKGASIQTLYRPFEDMFLPRLEFLVDVSALEKRDPSAYRYHAGPAFASLMRLVEGSSAILDDTYFESMAIAYGRAHRALTLDESIEHLRSAHLRFRNLAGYAPIVESVMYANAMSWERNPWPTLEFSRAFDFLHELARADPPHVRINTDRFRRPATFKIEV
jgi:hypothetical protein